MKEQNYNPMDIFALYFTLDRVFFREFKSQYTLENMNFTHFRAMMLLIVEGSSTMTQLSEKLHIEKGSFTSVANHLIKLGYVRRVKDDKDKRVSMLEATAEGKEFSDVVIGAHLEYIEKKLGGFTKEQKELYFAASKMLITMLNNL